MHYNTLLTNSPDIFVKSIQQYYIQLWEMSIYWRYGVDNQLYIVSIDVYLLRQIQALSRLG